MMDEREWLASASEPAEEESTVKPKPGSKAGYMARDGAIWGAVGLAAAGLATGVAAVAASIVTGGPHGAVFVAAVATAAAGTGTTGTVAGVAGGAARGKRRYEEEEASRQHQVELARIGEANDLAQANTSEEAARLRQELDAAQVELAAVRATAAEATALSASRAKRIKAFENGEAVQSLTASRDKYRQKARSAKAELVTEKARSAGLEAKVKHLSAKLDEATGEREVLQQQLDNLKLLYSESQECIERLTHELSVGLAKLEAEAKADKREARAERDAMRHEMRLFMQSYRGGDVSVLEEQLPSAPAPVSETQYSALLVPDAKLDDDIGQRLTVPNHG